MAKRVFRYEVAKGEPTMMPRSARILPVAQIRGGYPMAGDAARESVHVWAEVDDAPPRAVGRDLRVLCTGDYVPDGATWVATADIDRGLVHGDQYLVLHVYDATPAAGP